jgi:hypothetical protein
MSNLQQLHLFCRDERQLNESVEFYTKLGFSLFSLVDTAAKLHLHGGTGFELQLEIKNVQISPFQFSIYVESSRADHTAKQLADPMGNQVTVTNKPLYSELKRTLSNKKIDDNSTQHVDTTFYFLGVGKRLGVLTSGGDSCGMNAAVRSIARVALQKGCIPFAIYEGYQGLVDGGEKIKELKWADVRGFLSKGGTLIGTARCAEFRERPGRLKACHNLIKNGIDALVIIGGDGSLTGANLFRQEWQGLVDELVSLGEVTAEESKHLRSDLTIVGLVGSIDNDMSSTGTICFTRHNNWSCYFTT